MGYLSYGCDMTEGWAQLSFCQDPSSWSWISAKSALLCSVLLGLDAFAKFLPKWQGFCQEQDDFPATGTMSVDSVGAWQRLDASNRKSLPFFSPSTIPENHTMAAATATRRGKLYHGCRDSEPDTAGRGTREGGENAWTDSWTSSTRMILNHFGSTVFRRGLPQVAPSNVLMLFDKIIWCLF